MLRRGCRLQVNKASVRRTNHYALVCMRARRRVEPYVIGARERLPDLACASMPTWAVTWRVRGGRLTHPARQGKFADSRAVVWLIVAYPAAAAASQNTATISRCRSTSLVRPGIGSPRAGGLPGRRSWWWPLGSLSGGVRVVVFVVAADPDLGRVSLVAAERGPVEEAVVSDHEFEPAGGR